MKRFCLIAIALVGLASSAPAQDDTSKFAYRQRSAIPVGTVLHYVKSNHDGSDPEYVSQYLAATDKLESFKFHLHEEPAGWVIADLNWKTYSASLLTSWQVFSSEPKKLVGTIKFDAASQRAEIFLPILRPETEYVKLGAFPVHLYNFDFGSLNVALPHLRDARGSFVVGVTDPTFKPDGPLLEYRGTVTVKYVTEEMRNGFKSRKYRVDGEGLKNRGGFMWVDRKKGWITDLEFDLPDNPAWKNFKFKLLRVEKMNRPEWDNFMRGQIRPLKK